MFNAIQIRDAFGKALYPITDASLVIGLQDGGFSEYIMCWDGESEPIVSVIPSGVTVIYDDVEYTGTLDASSHTANKVYLVASMTQENEYDRYLTVHNGNNYTWKPISSTNIVSPVIADDLNTNDASKALSARQGVIIKDKLKDIEEEFAEINPHVTGRIGISATNEDIDPLSLLEYTNKFGIITLTLNEDSYLWVCLKNDHFRITSSGVEIPMTYVKESEGLHCYVSTEKLTTGTLRFTVESAYPIKADTERVIIEARSYTVTYGDPIPDFGYIADGAVVGIPDIYCSAVQGSDVGTYDIIISRGTVEDANAIYINGLLVIEKAELTVTADNKQVDVDGDMPAFTVQYSGFVLGEGVSSLETAPTCTTDAVDTSTEGNYAIIPGGGVAENYSFNYINGVLTVGDPVILTL